MTALVTRATLMRLLNNPARRAEVIGRALVVIFLNQTEAEKHANVTNNHNNIGFTSGDAHSGCLSAKYYLKHKTLQQWQIDMWMRPGKAGFARITKYHRQLNQAATARAETEARANSDR